MRIEVDKLSDLGGVKVYVNQLELCFSLFVLMTEDKMKWRGYHRIIPRHSGESRAETILNGLKPAFAAFDPFGDSSFFMSWFNADDFADDKWRVENANICAN